MAKVLQHEIDHTNGITFIDRLESYQKRRLKRELKEETGLTIDVVKPAYTFTKIRKDYQTVGIGYLASTDDDHVSISFEHTDYKWCSIDELKDYLCDEIYQDIIYTLKEYTSI